MKNLLWMLAGSNDIDNSNVASGLADDAKKIWANQVEPIVNVVLWILVAILAVVFIFKAITTAMAVMKAADEPQVRQEKLNGFKYLAIGLGVAIVVISLATTIMHLVTRNNVNLAADQSSTSFLF